MLLTRCHPRDHKESVQSLLSDLDLSLLCCPQEYCDRLQLFELQQC
jgi:hypothetical protein